MSPGCDSVVDEAAPQQAPIDASGSAMPAPRNPSALSKRTAQPTESAAYAPTTGQQVREDVAPAGSATEPAPWTRAASTYSRSRSTTACPYVTRAMGAQKTAARPRTSESTPRPRIVAMAAASSRPGIARPRSVKRMSTGPGEALACSRPRGPTRTPAEGRDRDRGEGREQRQPPAVEDPRQQVAALRVGAQRIARRAGVERLAGRAQAREATRTSGRPR